MFYLYLVVYLGIFLSLLYGIEYFIYNIKCIIGICVLFLYSCISSGIYIVFKFMVNIEVLVILKLNIWKWIIFGYVVDLGCFGLLVR